MKIPRAKVQFALRRPAPDSPLVWWPVRAQAVHLPVGGTLRLYSYRSGPMVFIFEYWSGVTVACGPTLPYARREAVRILTAKGVQNVRQACYDTCNKLNPGRKPRLKK